MDMRKVLGLGLVATGAITSGLLADVKPAEALVVHNGWNYTMDAHNDSTPFKRDGSGLFEIYGSAYKVIGETMVFAINSNVDLENGVDWDSAADDKVHFSDLLINFTGKSLDQANGELYAINFAGNGDSGAGALGGVGIYSNVTAKSVSGSNSGWSTLKKYNNKILGKNVTPTHGDLAYDDSYFDVDKRTLNVIDTGTKIGDIEYINDLAGLGLDFEHFGDVGSETMAFSFDLGLFSSEDVEAMFHFAMECNNDMVAGTMNFTPGAAEVPTPAVILPAILGMFGAASRKNKEAEEA